MLLLFPKSGDFSKCQTFKTLLLSEKPIFAECLFLLYLFINLFCIPKKR
jgi:hypothetical protein